MYNIKLKIKIINKQIFIKLLKRVYLYMEKLLDNMSIKIQILSQILTQNLKIRNLMIKMIK